jgi:hypothetical protein
MVSVPVQCPYCHSAAVIKRTSKPTGPNVISVKTRSAYGGSFSCRTRIAAEYLRSAARHGDCTSSAGKSKELHQVGNAPPGPFALNLQ